MKAKAKYQEIPLAVLDPNPWNPRTRFEGPAFEELVASITSKGVIQPIFARPKKDGRFEIVAGERRFWAACSSAESNGGIGDATIPAMVRSLTDGEVFDITLIKNLQRDLRLFSGEAEKGLQRRQDSRRRPAPGQGRRTHTMVNGS